MMIENVLEDIKQEKNEKFLKLLAMICAIIGVLSIIFTFAFSIYKSNKEKKSAYEANMLYDIMSNMQKQPLFLQKDSIYRKKLTELARFNSIYGAIASFSSAAIDISMGNLSEAIYQYERISENKSYDQRLRNYALILSLNARLMQNKITIDQALRIIDDKKLLIEKAPLIIASRFLNGALLNSIEKYEDAMESFKQISLHGTPAQKEIAKALIYYAKKMKSSNLVGDTKFNKKDK